MVISTAAGILVWLNGDSTADSNDSCHYKRRNYGALCRQFCNSVNKLAFLTKNHNQPWQDLHLFEMDCAPVNFANVNKKVWICVSIFHSMCILLLQMFRFVGLC